MKNTGHVPELILINGNFRTQDPLCPGAEAVAIASGRILAIGDNASIQALYKPGVEVIDLGGRLCIPGMMDSHLHYRDWALGRKQLPLADTASLSHLLDRVSEAAIGTPPGTWIVGQGWNENDWPGKRAPGRTDLDRAAPNHPVVLWRCDMHLAAVSSLALSRAGITENTPDPPEGVISRDKSGRPDGILREHAVNLIKDVLGKPDEASLRKAMGDGIPALHALGITGIEDVRLMDEPDTAKTFRAWQALRDAGDLALRCWVAVPGQKLDQVIDLGLATGFGDDRLRIGHVKFFSDGSMGARTAWLLEPYRDAGCGMPLSPMKELKEAVRRADQAGLSVMIHAIGDRANRNLIGLFEDLGIMRNQGRSGPRVFHRIEHVQMIRPDDISRLARLDVIASVQPANLATDIAMIDDTLGPLGRHTYPFRSLLDAGIRMIFSSDCPVCDPNPMLGIHAAVTRKRPDGTPEGGWHPAERITVSDAVKCYTLFPAMSWGMEKELGTISPGKRADLVVLERDIYAVEPDEIAQVRVDITVFDGKVVYIRE